MTRSATLFALIVAVALLASGCGNRFDAATFILPSVGPPPDGGPPIGVDSQLDIPHPLFAGLGDMLAGDGFVRLGWDVATDDSTPSEEIVYEVYLATASGEQDFTLPDFVTTPGETFAEFSGLTNGETVFAVVRAVDTDGNVDPNEVEWAAMPNPVRYVRFDAVGGDGLTPATAFPNLLTALAATNSQPGMNFWVAEGLYSVNAFTFLWPGRSAYGGFASNFDLATRDSANRITQISPEVISSVTPIVRMIVPGSASIVYVPGALSVFDGFSVSSTAQIIGTTVDYPAPIGVFAEDTFARITNCRFFNLASKGVELRSDFLNSIQIIATVRNCTIQDVGGEGIFLGGHPDVVIDNNLIQNTGTEGIEAQWVHASGNTSARIEVTRNRISNPGDEGIDLDFAEEDIFNPLNSLGARIRAFIRNNKVEGARLQGIQLDLDFQNSDEIDFRARIEDNEINDCGFGSVPAGEGILLDGDARGSFRVARNSITGNAGAGVRISGSFGGPYARLIHNRIIGNGAGIVAVGAIAVEVRHQILRANRGPAIQSDRAVITVANSILMQNSGLSNPAEITYSIIFGESVPPNAGDGVVVGDPGLENHPNFYTTAAGSGSGGLVPLASNAGWFVNDTVEIRNDGVARVVTGVGPTSITVSPPTSAFPGDLLAGWGSAESVIEAEGLLEGSPAIDGGDPLEVDRDGTRSDIGPIGGDTPGNIGIETAIPLESAALELIAIDPGPAELQSGSTWTLTFNRDLIPEVADLVTIRRDSTDLTPSAVVTVGERSIEFDLSALTFSPGETVMIELTPGQFLIGGGGGPFDDLGAGGGVIVPPGVDLGLGGGESLFQPAHLRFPSKIGAVTDDLDPTAPELNGSVATAQSVPIPPAQVIGAIGFLGDVDVYSVDLSAGQSLRAELYAAQIESTLFGRLTLIGSDGVTTIASSAAVQPFFFDPVLPSYTAPTAQTVYLRVATSEPTLGPVGDYRLILR